MSVAGALSRYGLDQVFSNYQKNSGQSTFVINFLGSGLAGLCVAISSRGLINPQTQTILLVGFCGSFTTFSAYTIATLNAVQRGESLWALGFFVLNPILCLLAAALPVVLLNKDFA